MMNDNALKDPEAKIKRRGLGRGLNALFEDEEAFESVAREASVAPARPAPEPKGGRRASLDIAQIEPNVSQPRQHFDKQALQELADSMKEHGVLQPILVRPIEGKKNEERYEIVAGERRWRAAQLAQLHEVPVIIRDLKNEQAYQIALVENLQREDLNPVEEARGYQKLVETYGYTKERLGQLVGKSRSHVSNTMRLLALPENLLEKITSGELSASHARTLVTADNPEALAREIMEKGMSVRAAEARAAELAGRAKKPALASGSPKSTGGYQKDADTLALEKEVSASLGMAVTIDTRDGASGTLRIEFKNLDQLDELLHRLSSLSSQRLMQ